MSDSKSRSVNVPLVYPISHGGQVIAELNLRPFKAGDLRRVEAPADREIAMVLELASYCSGQVQEVIDELEGEDLQKVLEVVGGFFADSPLTGKK